MMMKGNKNTSLVFVIFIMLAVVSVGARKHRSKNAKPDNIPVPLSAPNQSTIFDILSFGAKGDGVSDDSKALQAAWEAACKVPGATVEIPAKFKFLIKPITLQGPCMPHFVLQLDGTVLAPPEVGSWPKSSLFQWFNFKWIQDFTIQGTGTVNGQGHGWWTPSSAYFIQRKSNHIPHNKPTALRFYDCSNITVRDIEIVNSPQFHLKFDSSKKIQVNNITISSPENSPNTDGIHLQNTQDVEIQHTNIGTGDDCISIQTGCSNIHVHHINCGPGHGISIGSLGKDRSVACVSNIVVEEISLQNTLAGARIKTWQGGIGLVKNISFSNIQVSDVKYPIIIDQFYCDKHACKNQTEAIAITGVKFGQITGSYTAQPIHLACSSKVPCIDVDLIDIQLKPSQTQGYRSPQQAVCWNSYGKSQAPLLPSSIDNCLRGDGDYVKRTERSHDMIKCPS